MVHPWNINGMLWSVLALGLIGSSSTVLGDNYNVRDYNQHNSHSSSNNNHHNNRMRPGSFCEDLSPQQFIAMDHVRIGWECVPSCCYWYWVRCNWEIIENGRQRANDASDAGLVGYRENDFATAPPGNVQCL